MEAMQGDVWFVYDGECPICSMAAQALRIKQAVGALHLVNARLNTQHPVLAEVNARRLNLDEGMVLKFQGAYYHGQDALHLMALLGSPHGWFNCMNALLFRSRTVARVCYPVMRGMRNMLLYLKGVGKIDNLQSHDAPIFKAVFGKDWDALPPVMQQHYAVRPYSDDVVQVQGTLDVRISLLVRIIGKYTGLLLAYSGDNVPVTVTFRSGKRSRAFYFDRVFHFPTHGDVPFISRMEHLRDNIMVEYMRFGVGWKCAYAWDGEKVTLEHRGYVWRVARFLLPIPAGLLIGRGHAEEVPTSSDSFRMWTHANHAWWGKTFAYAGEFRILHRV
jgi:predicted DCC family thiol-disulfide oxidoreductase YuxK